MRIDDVLFEHLAKLSKLKFSAKEKSKIKSELEQMLDFIRQVQEVDTEGVEPLIHLNPDGKLREDVVKVLSTKEEVLKNAPDANEDYFQVPKVLNSK